MARIRTIKPTHWEDKELPKISLQAHLLWIALWNFSDDAGVIESDVLLIRSRVFPRRTDIRVEQVQTWLDQLVKARFIVPCTFNGEGYYINRTFRAHQRIDKPQASLIPDAVMFAALQENSENVPRSFPERSENDPRTVPPVEYSSSNSTGTVRGEDAPTAPLPPPKKKTPILFEQSEIFDKEVFVARLSGTQYEVANVDYYHEVINNWSNSGNNKKMDWLATAKNWIARDLTEGKLITKDFRPKNNGTASNNKSGTSAATEAYYRDLDSRLAGNAGAG